MFKPFIINLKRECMWYYNPTPYSLTIMLSQINNYWMKECTYTLLLCCFIQYTVHLPSVCPALFHNKKTAINFIIAITMCVITKLPNKWQTYDLVCILKFYFTSLCSNPYTNVTFPLFTRHVPILCFSRTPRLLKTSLSTGLPGYFKVKSLMAKWLEQVSQWYEMYCYDLVIMSSSPSGVELA